MKIVCHRNMKTKRERTCGLSIGDRIDCEPHYASHVSLQNASSTQPKVGNHKATVRQPYDAAGHILEAWYCLVLAMPCPSNPVANKAGRRGNHHYGQSLICFRFNYPVGYKRTPSLVLFGLFGLCPRNAEYKRWITLHNATLSTAQTFHHLRKEFGIFTQRIPISP